ncbi:hypothetical protein HBH98_187800 [Parastagonospora nodorum]|nr:hypothetical protein HBH98_187800 [Parastagonospora nodorum]KAH4367492.1 hypothetical protein HBH97_159500 [Parastagonospora nodorum]KAH4386221.1 hypothetical protein HBH99_172610 [Parastagonospora nodorum]KAH5034839.1 hypothetical protein HBI75_089470 [Parastagonospora nodorum]
MISEASDTERNNFTVALVCSIAAAFAISSAIAIATISKKIVTSKTQKSECETRTPTVSRSLGTPPVQESECRARPSTASHFLDLPPELRVAIYASFIPPAGCPCAGKYLRRVCRQVQVEFDNEIARQMTIRLSKSVTSAPFRVQWQVHTCDSPLYLSLPISILGANEYYDMYREKWPGSSNSHTYRLLSALPTYVKTARISFENDANVSEWYASYQIQKVKSAISSFMIDSKEETKCDLKCVEMYWGALVPSKAGRRVLATVDKRLKLDDDWRSPDGERGYGLGCSWTRKTLC